MKALGSMTHQMELGPFGGQTVGDLSKRVVIKLDPNDLLLKATNTRENGAAERCMEVGTKCTATASCL